MLILIALFCFAWLVLLTWYSKEDITLSTLLTIMLVAAMPIINIAVSIVFFLIVLSDKQDDNIIILKGRK